MTLRGVLRAAGGGIMSTPAVAPQSLRVPQLLGQTVVVIGGSAGIGFERARRARVRHDVYRERGDIARGNDTAKHATRWNRTSC